MGDGDRLVAACGWDGNNKAVALVDAENSANARLIAAAPEMLQLLKDAVAFLPLNDPQTRGFYDDARKLIAKAEGSQP